MQNTDLYMKLMYLLMKEGRTLCALTLMQVLVLCLCNCSGHIRNSVLKGKFTLGCFLVFSSGWRQWFFWFRIKGWCAGRWLPRRSLSSSVSTASLLPLQCPLGGAAQHKWGEAGFLPASPGSGSGWGGRRAELELSVSLPGCPRRRA